MQTRRVRSISGLGWVALVLSSCTSAGERLEQGIELQAQGRYLSAVYRYADALEKDRSLDEARSRLVAAADSALEERMNEAERLSEHGAPTEAASQYRELDRMIARVRAVGERVELPEGYAEVRRTHFDGAIEWRMELGDEAFHDGRWGDARRFYREARSEFEPSRDQMEASLDAETGLLLEWAEIELVDDRPRAAYGLAHEARTVRPSASRDVVLASRDLEARALEQGTLVVAIPPVTADEPIRDSLGPDFELRLDEILLGEHWIAPPPFVAVADPLVFRHELRGLLRGSLFTPRRIAHAAGLVGADLVAIVELREVEVIEEEVTRTTHPARVLDGGPADRIREPRATEFEEVEGVRVYHLRAEVLLVDHDGREALRFRTESSARGPFRRGEFDGNHDRLELTDSQRALFDVRRLDDQAERVRRILLDETAVAIARGTFEAVVSRIS